MWGKVFGLQTGFVLFLQESGIVVATRHEAAWSRFACIL
jgi:hypothetical protein